MTKRFMDSATLDKALILLEARLRQARAEPQQIVVCGGAALILTGMVPRTTSDVDIVALMRAGTLLSPDPLPTSLEIAAKEVADLTGMDPAWLNNLPGRGEGGLYQMGLPEGFVDRLQRKDYGTHLTVWVISRLDQIHFKLYAAIDRGGYHVEDLRALAPTTDELLAAARWCVTHDVSPEFRELLGSFLKEFGHGEVAERF